MRVLNRVLTWTLEGLELEADQRLAELIIQMLGLQGSKGVSTPGAKEEEEEEADGDLEELKGAEATRFGGSTASPRIDLSYCMQPRRYAGQWQRLRPELSRS